MNDLERAKARLAEGGATLAVCKGEELFTSAERGVKPLLQLIASGKDVRGYSAADLVVGRAAAFLYVLLGVRAVYAKVVSVLAEQVLEEYGIEFEAETRTERIKSFMGGNCPMESAVEGISDPAEALAAIRAKIAQMNK